MLFKFKLLFIIIALVFKTTDQYKNRKEHQVVSTEYVDQISDYPCIVSIELKEGGHICSGTIIHEHYILTAAHCIAACDGTCTTSVIEEIGKENRTKTICVSQNCTHYEPSDVWIRAGTTKLHNGGVIFKDIKKFYVHKLNNMYYSFDVGLIQLETPIIFTDDVKPIMLADVNDFMVPHQLATVLGYNFPTNKQDRLLKMANLEIFHNEVCSWLVALDHPPIEDSQVCIGTKGIICENDIGAPLIYQEKLYGIATMLIKGECSNNLPSLYVRISSVREWIDFYLRYV